MAASRLSSGEKTLRTILVCSFIPAFPLLIASGIHGRTLFSFLFLAPLCISVISSAVYLRLQAKHDKTLKAWIGDSLALLLELFLFCFYLGILIPFWINESQRWSWYNQDNGAIMLDTYASVFMIANMAIHFWFFFTNIKLSSTCPNCGERQSMLGIHKAPSAPGAPSTSAPTKQKGSGPVYSLLGDNTYDDDSLDEASKGPRLSTESAQTSVEEV